MEQMISIIKLWVALLEAFWKFFEDYAKFIICSNLIGQALIVIIYHIVRDLSSVGIQCGRSFIAAAAVDLQCTGSSAISI